MGVWQAYPKFDPQSYANSNIEAQQVSLLNVQLGYFGLGAHASKKTACRNDAKELLRKLLSPMPPAAWKFLIVVIYLYTYIYI